MNNNEIIKASAATICRLYTDKHAVKLSSRVTDYAIIITAIHGNYDICRNALCQVFKMITGLAYGKALDDGLITPIDFAEDLSELLSDCEPKCYYEITIPVEP